MMLSLFTLAQNRWIPYTTHLLTQKERYVRTIRPEISLEDFLVNRFGKKLYKTFFKDYTTKVWGVEPKNISAEWGAQRIKGLSIIKSVLHALQQILNKENSVKQKNVETSLIEQFLYPLCLQIYMDLAFQKYFCLVKHILQYKNFLNCK